MIKRLFIVILLIELFFSSPISRAETQLTILHTSEYHGTALPDEDGMGGLAYQATAIHQIRAREKNVLLLNSGDLLVGTLMSSVFRGLPDISAMNLMRYDAVVVGNHELDFGLTAFQNLRDLAQFPFLSANLVKIEDPLPRSTPNSETLSLPTLTQPWLVREFEGVTVAVLGLTTVEAREILDPAIAKQVIVLDVIPVARQIVQELKQQADLIIALTHQDTVDDVALAKAIPEIDVIVGGHTEGFDGMLTINPSTGDIPSTPVKELRNPLNVYVKTHRLGKTLGKLDLTVENGKILTARCENIPIDSRTISPDKEVAHLLKFYSDQLADKMDIVIGETLVDLNGERQWVRSQESNLGNFIADVVRNYTRTDISLINAGAIRASIKKGKITLGDLYRVFPFLGNTVVTLKVTGRDIQEALENSVSQIDRGAGRFLQVSGLTYTYDPKAPPGQRVLEVKVNGISLISDQIYTISTTNYLAEGGDGYLVFRMNKKQYEDTEMRLIDLLIYSIQKQKTINVYIEGRIVQKFM